MSAAAAYAINAVPCTRQDFYAIACDPARSVAVEACAGAGKTWMLIERMVNALAKGTQPDQILAITFTNKAAGEMRDRLEKRLADPALKELRACVLASGRSVEISTFHAWFGQLLKAAPLSVLQNLNYPLGYELLDDETVLLPQLRRAFYAAVLADRALKEDFSALIENLGRSKVDEALVDLLSKRVEFELADEEGLLEASVQNAAQSYPSFANAVQVNTDKAWLGQKPASLSQITLVAKLMGQYKTNELINTAWALEQALAQSNLPAVQLALLSKEFAPRKFRSKLSDIDRAVVLEAQAYLLEIFDVQHQHACWQYQQRMTRLGRVWLECFAKLKRDQGLVDMADLEQAATHLLFNDELSGAVQERLDLRLRHVMIDEFQDTNPLQWQALRAWLGSYAGSGGGGQRPSVFIVGDPKQSIYRFRRAEPRVFAAAQAFMHETFDAALLSCDHTRRNSAAVLDLVNSAMQNAQQANEYQGFRPHTTESTAAGLALCLPLIERKRLTKGVDEELVAAKIDGAAASTQSTPWRDSLTMPRVDAEKTLKEAEAEQAAGWIAAHTMGLTVMVLARTHQSLDLMQKALQRYGVVAEKLEKNDLADIPAVQDLLALLNFLVSPHLDLDLARALKSPLFAWSDAQLMTLRSEQLARLPEKISWFELLPIGTKTRLALWQMWLAQLPPHDALQAIYDDADVLNKYLAATPYVVRHSNHTALQALLLAALQVGGGRFLNAYGFVRAMRAKVQRIRAPAQPRLEAERGDSSAVQLLTIHGAKGLQADVVLLLNSDPEPRKDQTMTTLVDWSPEQPAPDKFVFLRSELQPPHCAKSLLEADFKARAVEELNTMYVAATRACQQIVLSACQSRIANPSSVWHRLHALCVPTGVVLPITLGQPSQVLVANAPNSLPNSIQISTKDLGQQSAKGAEPAVAGVLARPQASAASRRGSALHRLLQWECTADEALAAVAKKFLLSHEERQTVGEMARQMLTGEAAWLWDKASIDWQANEYELVHQGRVLRIDRLVKRRETQEWWVIDFKTAFEPEKSTALQAQLHSYQAALASNLCVPRAQIRMAFVSGAGRFVEMCESR